MSANIYNLTDALLAGQLLAACLRGERWPASAVELLGHRAETPLGSRALFSLAEALSDRFEPRLADAYADLFSPIIAAVVPGLSAHELRARYGRVRRPRRFQGEASTVFVLSRVTLGADIAVTSVLLDAAKRRFPRARLVLAGGRKNHELFAADPRIEPLEVPYGRNGTLRARLAAGLQLRAALEAPASIVIDPDSRLTQLGLLPVCDEERYFLFDSRAAEGEGSLACLAARWAEQTFGVAGARPYLAPPPAEGDAPAATASFGVGENPAKRLGDAFEARLLAALAERGRVVVDTGAGGEEAERVTRAAAGLPVELFHGSFAAFAGRIARSRLYVGYDSAGQHAAAALGVPLVAVFAGYPCPRFVERWRPTGPGRAEIVRAAQMPPADALAQVLQALHALR